MLKRKDNIEVKVTSKVTLISILAVHIFLLVFIPAYILAWWNGFTPLISRAEIENRLDRALTIDYEYVSSKKIKGNRSEMHYIYKDANGIEFTVRSYKVRLSIYDADLWWSNRAECNYTQRFMDQYESYIKGLFGDRLESDSVNIYNYEQVSETADMLAEMYAEIPPYPINREVYDDLFNVEPRLLVVKFRYGDDYMYARKLEYFKFLCDGEKIPNRSEILVSLENSVASLYKLDVIDIEIPNDVLMREPPAHFESVMIGDTDINPELTRRGVYWEENEKLLYPHYKGGRYQFSTDIFGGDDGSFAYMVKELGGSYEYINTDCAKWEISGDIWEAHRESSKRIDVGIAEYDVDNIKITKNGIDLPPLESQVRGKYSLKDIEMLLGVRAEYTNDVAVLYLIQDKN